ncbi:hypothetical protein PFISCL1PPCAC_26225, partial [Pristionchus fissidentatus]
DWHIPPSDGLQTPTFENFTPHFEYDSLSVSQLLPHMNQSDSNEAGHYTYPWIVELVPDDPGVESNSAPASVEGESTMDEPSTSRIEEANVNKKSNRRSKDKRELVVACLDDCEVCGDRSTGHHYDVASCNGCKSFFRRTLLDGRRFVCETDGACPVLPKTRKEQKRRQCRACRYRKCVEVGMNPNGIVVEDEKEREALIRVLKRPSLLHVEIPHKIVSVGERFNRLVDNLQYIEFRHQLLRASELNPLPSNPQTILDILQRPTAMGMPQIEMTGWPLSQKLSNTAISLEEHVQLRIPLPRFPFERLPPTFKFWFYADLVYACEWARTLDFFRELDLNDQRELICFGGWQILNITHSFFSYSKGSEKALFPDGKFSVWTPREAERDVITPMIKLQIDRTEYILLKALVLCNPTCDRISDRARSALEKERQKLTRVLLNHCMKTHGQRGPARFGDILALETTMLHQAKKTKELQSLLTVLKLRTTRINLMDEICDIDYVP